MRFVSVWWAWPTHHLAGVVRMRQLAARCQIGNMGFSEGSSNLLTAQTWNMACKTISLWRTAKDDPCVSFPELNNRKKYQKKLEDTAFKWFFCVCERATPASCELPSIFCSERVPAPSELFVCGNHNCAHCAKLSDSSNSLNMHVCCYRYVL